MTHFKLIAKLEINSKIFYRLKSLLKEEDTINSFESPDFIIVIGGDGTILKAERDYPNIPKITFRDSDIGSKCKYSLNDFEKVINKIADRKYKIITESKLRLQNYGDTLVALNEIQLHNESPMSAVRFSLYLDNKIIFDTVIGDGVIISTPFGSGGYYKSVTGGKTFTNHIGIGLNNPYNYKRRPYLVQLNSEIKIKMHRRNGILIADNNPNFIVAKENNEYIIKLNKNPATFVEVI